MPLSQSVFSFLSEQGSDINAEPGPPIIDEYGTTSSGIIKYDDDKQINTNRQEIASTQTDNDTPLYAFTCVVGKKPSHAFTYVDDARDVSSLLLRLAGLNDSTLSDEAMAGIEYT